MQPFAAQRNGLDVVLWPLMGHTDGEVQVFMKRRMAAAGSTLQALHQSQNSARSTLRLPVSQL